MKANSTLSEAKKADLVLSSLFVNNIPLAKAIIYFQIIKDGLVDPRGPEGINCTMVKYRDVFFSLKENSECYFKKYCLYFDKSKFSPRHCPQFQSEIIFVTYLFMHLSLFSPRGSWGGEMGNDGDTLELNIRIIPNPWEFDKKI